MDPFIQQWSQSADAQPYIQQASQSLGGGFGQSLGGDPYSQYIQQLINANSGDPDYQRELTGYFLDYNSPDSISRRNSYEGEQQLAVQEMLINTGLSMISSDDPEERAEGREIINSVISGYGIGTGTEGDTEVGGGYKNTALTNRYGSLLEGETNPDKLALYDLLASGDEDVANTYYGAKPTVLDRFGAWVLPGGMNWWDAKPSKSRSERAVKDAYGI